jgi:tetratricopeptide (TPR) repeat protein
MIANSWGPAAAGPSPPSRKDRLVLFSALALSLTAAAAAQGLTRQIPKSMQASASQGAWTTGGSDVPAYAPPDQPALPAGPRAPAPTAPPPAANAGNAGGDAWSNVLFNTPSPFSPGAVTPRPQPQPGLPGAPGLSLTPANPLSPTGPAAPTAPVAPLGADEKPSPERVGQLYRQALVLWASGQAEIACTQLMAMETRVVRDSDLRTARSLLKSEEKVIDHVAAGDLEVLVPIARLHFEAYRRYLNQGGPGRALVERHSRIMVHDLALLYRKQSGTEGATLVASHLLTTLGDLSERGAQHETAAELYTQAAGLDARNPVPALNLAVIYEKFEQYKSAVAWLRKALAVDAANPEIRLRLAINLGRVGAAAEARAMFEKLTAEPGESWVTPLAFQELGRLDERKEALTKAAAVLRAGVTRFPKSVRLRIQLASVLDRQGNVREARQVIEEVPGLAGDAHEGARFRYNQTGTDAVAVSRSFFEENAASRMRVLADALARTAAAGDETAAAPPAAPPAEVQP